jgi:hypothetical protein
VSLGILVFGLGVAACGGKTPPPRNEPASGATAACQPVTCEIKCVNGFKKDATGCEVCECASAASAAACEPVTCDLSCPKGFATDDKGCQTCKCTE